jgi:hypothetical protein
MKRKSSNQESVQRINFVLKKQLSGMSREELKNLICESFDVSSRQAMRYMKEAKEQTRPLPIPEQKIVFTVKLPPSVAQQIRLKAKEIGIPLSDLVQTAIEIHLQSDIYRGSNEE